MKNKVELFCYEGKISDPDLHTNFRQVREMDIYNGCPVFAEGEIWIYNAEDKQFYEAAVALSIIEYEVWDGSIEHIKHIEAWVNEGVQSPHYVLIEIVEGVVSAVFTIKEGRRITSVSLEAGDIIVKLSDGSIDAFTHEEVIGRYGHLAPIGC